MTAQFNMQQNHRGSPPAWIPMQSLERQRPGGDGGSEEEEEEEEEEGKSLCCQNHCRGNRHAQHCSPHSRQQQSNRRFDVWSLKNLNKLFQTVRDVFTVGVNRASADRSWWLQTRKHPQEVKEHSVTEVYKNSPPNTNTEVPLENCQFNLEPVLKEKSNQTDKSMMKIFGRWFKNYLL